MQRIFCFVIKDEMSGIGIACWFDTSDSLCDLSSGRDGMFKWGRERSGDKFAVEEAILATYIDGIQGTVGKQICILSLPLIV